MASAKTDIAQDTYLIGIGVSPGVAIGEVHLINRAPMAGFERSIREADVEDEIAAFRKAIQLSKQQLNDVRSRVSDQRLAEHLYIIDTHLLILDDKMLVDDTIAAIRERRINAEGALKLTLEKVQNVFSGIEDDYLRERFSDIEAVVERVLRNLMGESLQPLRSIDRKVIVVAHGLSPADTLQIDRKHLLGFVTDVGGSTSHTAIFARSLGIPAVVGLETATSMIPGGTPVIIDGSSGMVILNPSQETFREFLKKRQLFEYQERELLGLKDLPGESLDGRRVILRGNVELQGEILLAKSHGAEGVGLFRSEFLFLGRVLPPDEEEQYAAYRDIAEQMAPHEVTIRTLDVGGDKFVPHINLLDEANPALGLRAVRFSLAERQLFRSQLRAIARASAHGRVRVMVPMISGLAEVRICRQVLLEVQAELLREKLAFDPDMPLGIMIETPAAVLIADLLANEVDFFSVGTNDLIQYCLAVDRGNEHVAYLYQPLHPVVLRALKLCCDAAGRAGIGISICGEMAAEPLYAAILLGLGYTELSMNPPCLPRVKRVLRRLEYTECQLLMEELLELPTAEQVTRRVEDYMAFKLPELFGRSSI